MVGAALVSGCGDDLAPYSRLDRLRLLAMKAEPASPLPGETAALAALAFAPAGEAIAHRWSWCPVPAPADQGYACPLDHATAARVLGPYLDPGLAGALPSFELGAAATASLANPFSAAGLDALCAAGIATPDYAASVDCEGGFPLTVVLDLHTTAAALRAGFVLRLPTTAAPERNHNPAPAALLLGGTALTEPPLTLAVAPDQRLELSADFPAAEAELRSIPAYEGAPGQRLERLTASWFSDHGSIETDRTSFIDGETTLADLARNRFTAPAADAWPADGLVELAVVLRDDRGGAGWLVRRVALERTP